MRLLILLVIVGVCLVSAKYLPDETSNFKQELSRYKRSDSEDSLDESNSNDTDNISNEELTEQSKLHARIEKMRQKLLEKQGKERRKQEEAQQKLEEKIAKELQKEEEKRQKEEEKRQKELQKEEEKRQQELQKHEEKLQKERRKLEEEQQKLREKVLKNERKRQDMLQKQLEEIEVETLKLQESDSNSSDSDTDESNELEDFWKSYIYSKYGLNESNTDLEKRIALRRYMQEELGLNVNSTDSERRQAVLRLIENKWQAVSEQYALQSQMIDFVNRVGVQNIRAQLEEEIEELNNKTVILNNVSLPWAPLARDNFAEQVSFLQTIKEFLASMLPNWNNENISSTQAAFDGASNPNDKVSSIFSKRQDVSEFTLVNSDISNKSDSLSSSNLDKNSPPSTGSENSAYEGTGSKDADSTSSSIGIGVNTDKSFVLDTDVNNADIVSTKLTGSASDSVSDFTVSNSKGEVDSNGWSTGGLNLDVGTNSKDIKSPISESTTNTLSNHKDTASTIPYHTVSGVSLNNEQSSDGSVNTNVVPIASQDSLSDSSSKTKDSTNSAAPQIVTNSVSVSDITIPSDKTTIDDVTTSKILNNIVNKEKSDSSSPMHENNITKINVNNNLSSNDGFDDSLNGSEDKIKVASIDQDTAVTNAPTNGLSMPVTKKMSSLMTTEAPKVVSPVVTDLENNLNSDTSENSGNIVPNAKDNQIDVSNSSSPNSSSNSGNIVPSITESSRLNIITSIGVGTGMRDNVGDISTTSNTASSTDEAINSNLSINNDEHSTITLSPAMSTDRQDSTFYITIDSTNTRTSDVVGDLISTVIPENSKKIIIPNADSVHPIFDVALNDRNEENTSTSINYFENEISLNTNISNNITPTDGPGNHAKTVSISVTTLELPKKVVNVSFDNSQTESVYVISKINNDTGISKTLDESENQNTNEPTSTVSSTALDITSVVSDATFKPETVSGASKVDVQNISKTLDVSENQNTNEPVSTVSSISLDTTSKVSDANVKTDDIILSSTTPSAFITKKVDGASSNTDVIINKNSSTTSGDAVSDTKITTELPTYVTDTQSTVLDQSTSVVSNAEQLGDNNVIENQHVERDVTLPDAGIPIVTETIPKEVVVLSTTNPHENDFNDSNKGQKNPINDIPVPVEPGASVIAVAQQ